MPDDAPPTFAAGPGASADLNSLRNTLRWTEGFIAGSKPFARVHATASVALPTDGWNTLSFDGAIFNRGETPLYDGGSPTVLTIPYTGFYLLGACVRTEATTANKALRIYSDGQGGSLVEHDNVGVSTPAFTQINVCTLAWLASGDTIHADVFQDSGGTINAVVDGLASPIFWCAWYAIDDD